MVVILACAEGAEIFFAPEEVLQEVILARAEGAEKILLLSMLRGLCPPRTFPRSLVVQWPRYRAHPSWFPSVRTKSHEHFAPGPSDTLKIHNTQRPISVYITHAAAEQTGAYSQARGAGG